MGYDQASHTERPELRGELQLPVALAATKLTSDEA